MTLENAPLRLEWAGVGFVALDHHDGRFFRAPGLYGYARREASGDRTLLYLGHADLVCAATGPGAPAWADALALGMNELHLCLKAQTRLDRLQLADRIIRRVGPLLNVIEGGPGVEAHPVPAALSLGRARL